MTKESLRKLIEQGVAEAKVLEVEDLTGTEDHFRVLVESKAFCGLSLVEQHKLVYQAVGEHLTNSVHALSIQTRIPQEPSKQFSSGG